MKKILFITPFSPNSGHAGAVYTNLLLKELSQECLIDLIYFYYNKDKQYEGLENVKILNSFCVTRIKKVLGVLSLFWVFPIFSARFSYKILKFINKQISEKSYDFIYFDFSQTFVYSLFIDHPSKILMSHDVMAQKFARKRQYLRPWVIRSEKILLKTGAVFTFSEKDCNIIEQIYHYKSLPTTFFISDDVKNAFPTQLSDYYVFFGGWVRADNYEALEWYVKYVNPLKPGIKYKIIGGGLPERLRKILPNNFDYMGFVENPYPIIASAQAVIAPLKKGAGVKVKCIDALGCGTPVIGSEVAFEGIPSEFKKFMLHAELPQDYIKCLNNMNVVISERVAFKNYFIKEYNDKNILRYIYGKL